MCICVSVSRCVLCVSRRVYLCGINKVSERVYYNFVKPKPNVFLLTICCVWRMFWLLFLSLSLSLTLTASSDKQILRLKQCLMENKNLFEIVYFVISSMLSMSIFPFCFFLSHSSISIELNSFTPYMVCRYNCSISSAVLTFLCCQKQFANIHKFIEAWWNFQYTAQHNTEHRIGIRTCLLSLS